MFFPDCETAETRTVEYFYQREVLLEIDGGVPSKLKDLIGEYLRDFFIFLKSGPGTC